MVSLIKENDGPAFSDIFSRFESLGFWFYQIEFPDVVCLSFFALFLFYPAKDAQCYSNRVLAMISL